MHSFEFQLLLDRIIGILYGSVIGDAVGLGSEFMRKDEVMFYYPKVYEITQLDCHLHGNQYSTVPTPTLTPTSTPTEPSLEQEQLGSTSPTIPTTAETNEFHGYSQYSMVLSQTGKNLNEPNRLLQYITFDQFIRDRHRSS